MSRANICRLVARTSTLLIALVVSARAADRRPEDLGVIPTPQDRPVDR